VLGAERKVELIARERLDDGHRAEVRERLSHTRTGAGIDWEALQDVRDWGWAPATDD
jgi:hypothetical protein